MKKSKDYYLKKYDELVSDAIKEADEYYDTISASKENRDYGEWISEAESIATTEEVVGYYLATYPDDYKPMWEENTEGIVLTNQDKEVSAILSGFWGERSGSKQDI